jgi:hypothetical protein
MNGREYKDLIVERDNRTHLDLDTVFSLLVIIEREPLAGHTLADRLGVSLSTLKRLISNARTALEMDIVWEKNRYVIRSWGMINPNALARRRLKRAR